MSIINLEERITTSFSCFLPSNSREQRSNVGILGIAAHSMLVSLPPYGLFVAFAGTKHCCLTAINRCGALCCPDFPRDRGLKQMFFFPYPAIDRHTIFISLTSVIFYGVLLLKFASNSFYLPRALWARGKRRMRCRPKDADKCRSCDKRIYSLLLIRFPLLKLASNSFYLPRASWARGKRRKRCRPKDADKRRSCDKRIPTQSGIRESNPPPRLGKPMHYRCANAAIALQNYYFFFIYAKKTTKYLFFPQRTCIYFIVFPTRASAFVYIGVRD